MLYPLSYERVCGRLLVAIIVIFPERSLRIVKLAVRGYRTRRSWNAFSMTRRASWAARSFLPACVVRGIQAGRTRKVASSVGLEPTAFGFGNRRSVQLSYEDMKQCPQRDSNAQHLA